MTKPKRRVGDRIRLSYRGNGGYSFEGTIIGYDLDDHSGRSSRCYEIFFEETDITDTEYHSIFEVDKGTSIGGSRTYEFLYNIYDRESTHEIVGYDS
jgi:hypothetical protein